MTMFSARTRKQHARGRRSQASDPSSEEPASEIGLNSSDHFSETHAARRSGPPLPPLIFIGKATR